MSLVTIMSSCMTLSPSCFALLLKTLHSWVSQCGAVWETAADRRSSAHAAHFNPFCPPIVIRLSLILFFLRSLNIKATKELASSNKTWTGRTDWTELTCAWEWPDITEEENPHWSWDISFNCLSSVMGIMLHFVHFSQKQITSKYILLIENLYLLVCCSYVGFVRVGSHSSRS